MPVKSVTIIKEGTICIEAFEKPKSGILAVKEFCGVGSGSTVTYVESDVKIIVDTGFDFENVQDMGNVERNRRNLIFALSSFGLKPEDIDVVFITHWHCDHFGNLDVFNHSKILASEGVAKNRGFDCKGVRDGEEIADGVSVIYTPGHTKDHASLLLEVLGRSKSIIAVAGDAVVSPSYYILNKVWNYNGDFYSMEAALESMRKIKEVSDYIIPGHGNIFKNSEKKESENKQTKNIKI
ncbi:MAG: MBL fold metallo-hydrolase [Candidatus Altiarchaeum hamiconexum]|uniref:Metallo-beta-lactamase domain-containing protein 1 n=1 Tax=Candidatus Altarchaeum hamiconexum TaxID=1803513 RepID=A0A8J7YRX6_9ARCH|nr:MBL fold metallo-hydrolase [Candidatus Altarchaeum hamiconexum]NCN68444.1 MBL fold metallo-hydrolase [Candidatus Altarchaeum hamiconexum]NCS90964.1 MBL fold metallo-hydrolase [Candidatus Altarchaeum hamiconexum]